MALRRKRSALSRFFWWDLRRASYSLDRSLCHSCIMEKLENNPSIPMGSIFSVLRSEEHTSELQSRPHLVCRLLLEKKKHITLRPVAMHNTMAVHDALR